MGSILSRVNKSTTTTAKEAKMAPVGMTYYEKAQSTFKPPLIANENAFLGDISSRYDQKVLSTPLVFYNGKELTSLNCVVKRITPRSQSPAVSTV